MLLKANPAGSFSGRFRIPSSKPETQRAILCAVLADGKSCVFNDLRCAETDTMKAACRTLGATIIDHTDHLEIHGIGRHPSTKGRLIDAAGSGLVFRTMAAISSAFSAPTILTGDQTLRKRVMSDLLQALGSLGAEIYSICENGKAPVVNWGHGLRGGRCTLPGNVSSQFITAILLAAPFAERAVDLEILGDVYSESYIQQTIAEMRSSGISVSASADLTTFHVEPGTYLPYDRHIREDYTSASYLLAAASLYPGHTTFENVHGESRQGERAIVDILRRLGLEVEFDSQAKTLSVHNPVGRLEGDYEFDATDYPNIVPTLAAIGSYVEGTFRVIGGRITRFHKASRIEAMVNELTTAGVDIRLVHNDGVVDGFEIKGRNSYPGWNRFSSWGDHRIFMSLFVAGLRMEGPSYYSGFEDVRLSFPDFFDQFGRAGVAVETTEAISPDFDSREVA